MPPDPRPRPLLPAEVLQDTAATFGLLASPARLHILALLASGERDVGTLAEELEQSVATVSHHLGKLKLAGLVRARRQGKHQIYLIGDPYTVELVHHAIDHHSDQQAAPTRTRKRSRTA